jgi:hypothetical protein
MVSSEGQLSRACQFARLKLLNPEGSRRKGEQILTDRDRLKQRANLNEGPPSNRRPFLFLPAGFRGEDGFDLFEVVDVVAGHHTQQALDTFFSAFRMHSVMLPLFGRE